MNAIIKSMWIDSATNSLEDYVPNDLTNFGLWINFSVCLKDTEGADDYQVFVCTPDWLKNSDTKKGLWGRHMLIVLEYDIQVIQSVIKQCVESVTGKDSTEVMLKLHALPLGSLKAINLKHRSKLAIEI